MNNKKGYYTIIYAVLVLLIVILAVWNLFAGSVDITIDSVWGILCKKVNEGTEYRIIHDIRMPRVIAAIVLGGALSVSGFLLQTFFQNPIAGPYILGISSGAKLFVALFMIIMLKNNGSFGSFGMILAAFAGSMIATGFVLIIANKTRKMSILIVCGILIGYVCSAITDLCITFADDSNIVNLHNWSLGSLSGMNWKDCAIMTIVVAASVFMAFIMSKPIGAYQMGEEYAKSMGVSIKSLRTMIIILSGVLSAVVTAFAGPISFVGIAVPHLIKSITKTSKPIIHIPACFLGGAAVTLLCDGLARMLFAPTELSISSVTAILLVPVVIFMMLKVQGGRHE